MSKPVQRVAMRSTIDRNDPITIEDLAELTADPTFSNAEVLDAILRNGLNAQMDRSGEWKGSRLLVDLPGRLLALAVPSGQATAAVRFTGATRVICSLVGRSVYSEYAGTTTEPKTTLTRTLGDGQLMTIPPGTLHAIRRHPSSTEAQLLDCRLATSGGPIEEPLVIPLGSSGDRPDDYYYEYDECYTTVYAEGAQLWETAEPNAPLVRFLEQFSGQLGSTVVDLGCGEGRDSLYLASRGFEVLGIDVSRAALGKARELARARGLRCKFLEWDVLYLDGIPGRPFDLAINMGCLHMLSNSEHRKRHLTGVFDILKPGGLFLLAHCRQEWLKGFYSVPHYDQIGPAVTGRVVSRRIRLAGGGVKWIDLPTTHFKESSEADLARELADVGFQAAPYDLFCDEAFGNTAVLVATKSLR